MSDLMFTEDKPGIGVVFKYPAAELCHQRSQAGIQWSVLQLFGQPAVLVMLSAAPVIHNTN